MVASKLLWIVSLFLIVNIKNSWAITECDCGENEEYDPCYNPCPSQLCEDIGNRTKCPDIPPNKCKPACKCIMNHRRDVNGDCVHITDCPPLVCPDENEFFDYCPSPCFTDICDVSIVCEDPEPWPYECFPSCLCNKDYGFCRSSQTLSCRAENEPDPCTKANEVWTECGNNGCQKTCDSLFDWKHQCNETLCLSGCTCAEGYIRNRLGECVKLEDCGVGVCGENESYTFCRPCPKGFACAAACMGPSLCVCNEGYIRDESGKCYKPKPINCKKANEVFDICPIPERTCAHVFNDTYPYPGIDRCKPACVCKDTHARKDNEECVLFEKCCADPNAVVAKCPYNCGGGTCANLAIDKNCKKACPDRPLGCECGKGYTRRDENSPKCIKISQCPKKKC